MAHRRRVEERLIDIAGLRGPSWADVASRDYRAWSRERIVIDTAGQTVEQSVATLQAALPAVVSASLLR